MAIPSGSGTEVLKRAYCHDFQNTPTYIDWAVADGETDAGNSTGTDTRVPANVIITILNIIICRYDTSASSAFTLTLEHASNDNLYLIRNMPIAPITTFVWNEKIVLRESDELAIHCPVDGNDCWISYIYQDWTS